jgi:hypothetical protein
MVLDRLRGVRKITFYLLKHKIYSESVFSIEALIIFKLC